MRIPAASPTRANPVRQSAPRGDPQRSVGIHQQRADEIVGQAVRRGERVDLAAANAAQPIRRAHPHVAVRRGGQRQDHVAGQPVAHGVVADRWPCPPRRPHHVQPAAAGAHPQRPGAVFDNRGGVVGGKSIMRCQCFETLIAQDVQAAGLGAHPEIALAVFHQGENGGGGQRIGDRKAVQLAH